ncbi:MAG TPA: MerR family transcriptional regulator [Armatimonadota bacterium]|nr:MerR family transcriptional regulator [Armatimonadota bacterium]
MHTPPDMAIYPMGTVVRMTGVAAPKLRFWETRYGLIQPARDPMGRRLYSKDDVGRIKLVKGMLDQGLNLLVVSRMLQAKEQGELQRV